MAGRIDPTADHIRATIRHTRVYGSFRRELDARLGRRLATPAAFRSSRAPETRSRSAAEWWPASRGRSLFFRGPEIAQ